MKSSLRYAAAGVGIVALGVLLCWPFLGPVGRRGVVIAASIALPVQIVSYAFLQRFKGQSRGFLMAWVGGTFLRMLVIGGVAAFVVRTDLEMAAPTLLALASFFFVLLLLEPMHFRQARQSAG